VCVSKFSQWSLSTLFHFRSKVRGEPVENHRVSNPYHAVSIVTCLHPCDTAKKAIGQRFLSKQAPRLPLPGCDAERCECKFRHHGDRRAGPRRRDEIGVGTNHWDGANRRKKMGRRNDD
jgi:hypothetical protein